MHYLGLEKLNQVAWLGLAPGRIHVYCLDEPDMRSGIGALPDIESGWIH